MVRRLSYIPEPTYGNAMNALTPTYSELRSRLKSCVQDNTYGGFYKLQCLAWSLLSGGSDDIAYYGKMYRGLSEVCYGPRIKRVQLKLS